METQRINYRRLIEENFLIDEPDTGALVPFTFRPVQHRYYDELVRDYDIENRGISAPVREIILKARREGFSSLVLAIFAADDLVQANPTETVAYSYIDESTKTFRRRYRTFVTSFFAKQEGFTTEEIQQNISILDAMAHRHLEADGANIVMKHNKAHFYCGTASAKTGGRGGVLQKLLFSEEAHYPDTDNMSAKEIVDGTLRQVDIHAGWVFRESTANGYGNYYELTWGQAVKGESRFKPRFYGWREMYTSEEFQLIASETTDKQMLKQEYPETAEEAFLASGTGFFDNDMIMEYLKRTKEPEMRGHLTLSCTHPVSCKSLLVCDARERDFSEDATGDVQIWEEPKAYHSYILSGDVAEGVDGDYSIAKVKDAKTLKTVAKFKSKLCPPDEYAVTAYALGQWYNYAYTGIESNKDGLWVNNELFKMGYPNLYFREQLDDITNKVSRKVGFYTGPRERPVILSELRKVLSQHSDCWNDKEFLAECLTFVRNKVGRPEAMNGKHDDEIMTDAIGLEIRRNAPEAFEQPREVPQSGESYVIARLEKLKSKKHGTGIPTQNDFIRNH
jgi:hypothetical protein